MFNWISDESRRLAEALRHRGTWFIIALLAVFSGIVYTVFRYALRMDFLLRIHHLAGASCSAMDNGTMLTIFFSSIFFGLALLVAFGELARHSDFSRRHSHAEARSAALLCVGWIVVALAIGATMLALLVRHCA